MQEIYMPAWLKTWLYIVVIVSAGINQVSADATEKPKSCSEETGGSSDSLMASNNGKYDCAYTAGLDNKKISAWETQTWTSSTALGYTKKYNCHGQSGGVSISSNYVESPKDTGSYITYWAYNTQDGSRHWGAGVLWETGANGGVRDDQYIHNCDGNHGDIKANKVYATSTSITSYPGKVAIGTVAVVNVSVKALYGNSPAQGSVYLYQQKNASSTAYADPMTDWIIGQGELDSSGNATIYTTFIGQDAAGNPIYPIPGTVAQIYAFMPPTPNVQTVPPATPPQKGWTPSQSDSYGVKLNQPMPTTQTVQSISDAVSPSVPRETPVFSDLSGSQISVQSESIKKDLKIAVQNVLGEGRAPLSALCPGGMKPLNSDAWGDARNVSDNDIYAIQVKGLFGVQVKLPVDRSNTQIQLQVLCRNTKEDVGQESGTLYGTPRADQLTSMQEDTVIFGGFGNDVVHLINDKTLALGGPGDDSILLSANQTVANGGLGNDRIEVEGVSEALIIGGRGKDTLIGGKGLTRINALDGKPGDKILCKTDKSLVMADEGDIITGPCTRIYPDNTQY